MYSEKRMVNEYWLLISNVRKKSYLNQNIVLWGWEIKGLLNFILVVMGKGAGEFYSELVEKFILNLWYS